MNHIDSHKNLAIDNSFTLIMENLSGVETDISLFLLGVFGNTIPIDSSIATIDFNGADGTGHFEVLNRPAENGEDMVTNPSIPTGLNLRFTNDLGAISTFNIAPNTTLDDCNILINNAVPYPTGTTGTDVQFIFGFKVGGNPKNMFYSINHTGTSSKIVKVDLITSATTTATGTTPYLERAVATNGSTSMVSVRDSAGLTYDEILRSQNGSVLDVRSMGYNLLGANSPTDQMNQCMRFDKIDVNGNSVTYYKCPVKDPYQFQNSFGIIDMGKKADIYTLDGETQFNYLLKPFTSCQITFNYAELTNLMLVPSEIAEAQYQSEKLQELNEREDYNREVEIVTPAETEGAFSSANGEMEMVEGEEKLGEYDTTKASKSSGLGNNPLGFVLRYRKYILGALGLGIVYFAFGKKLGIRK